MSVYNLDREDTFNKDKRVFRAGANYIVFTYAKINDTHYSWKVQFNTIVKGSSVNFTQMEGTSQSNPANIIVSPSLTKIILQGTDSTQSGFVGKSINWTKKLLKTITLPITTTPAPPTIALSDDYLYLNYAQSDKTHTAYMFLGSTCIQLFS